MDLNKQKKEKMKIFMTKRKENDIFVRKKDLYEKRKKTLKYSFKKKRKKENVSA